MEERKLPEDVNSDNTAGENEGAAESAPAPESVPAADRQPQPPQCPCQHNHKRGLSASSAFALMLVSALIGGLVSATLVKSPDVQVASPGASSTAPLPNSTAELVKRVSPSVVSLRVADTRPNGDKFAGSGSGFIVDERGYIMTNYHVVKDASRIRVWLNDEDAEYAGHIVGTDPGNDLALVKIDPGNVKLRAVAWGNSQALQVGDPVVAIGYPFHLPRTVTTGILSGKDRSMNSQTDKPLRYLLQIDAAINPGNSGGALFNSRGEVVGINTAIESPVQGFVGVGFAVPSNTAKSVLPFLMQGQEVAHPRLGVQVETLTEAYAREVNLPVKQGVLVRELVKGAPGDKAGLKDPVVEGDKLIKIDIITAMDGKPVRTAPELIAMIETHLPGDQVVLTVQRGQEVIQLTVVLEAWTNQPKLYLTPSK